MILNNDCSLSGLLPQVIETGNIITPLLALKISSRLYAFYRLNLCSETIYLGLFRQIKFLEFPSNGFDKLFLWQNSFRAHKSIADSDAKA